MKKNSMLIVCLSFLCAGCIIITDNSVPGSGHVITQSYDVHNFTGVELLGSMSAKIVQGDTFKVEVTIDDNLIDMVDVDVWDNQLKIGMRRHSSWGWRGRHTVYRVLITMPTMRKLQVSGSAAVIMEGFKDSSPYYDITVSGSGNVKAETLVAEKITASVKGSGSITLKGHTKELEHTLSSSGALYAFDCPASVVNVMVKGSGTAQVAAADSLDVTISGSGDVMYKGTPAKLQTKIRGSGRVHPTL